MTISGDRYFVWEWSSPLLPNPLREDLNTAERWATYIGPNGQLYKGTWTFFGKHRNIYSDEQIAFRKEEYPVALAA